MRTIKQALYVNSLAQNRRPDEGKELHALATSFAYALENIPTQHLAECFQRAIRNNTDDFLLTAGAVNREYAELIPELQELARRHSQEKEYQLKEGRGSLGDMTVVEWKERHNMPADWRLGQNYPPESDLYNGPYPEREEVPAPPKGWSRVGSPWKHG